MYPSNISRKKRSATRIGNDIEKYKDEMDLALYALKLALK
jgi:hypothetical protein